MRTPPDARMPVTLLSGLSSALREQVAISAIRERAGACAVLYDLDVAHGSASLLRRTLDAHGEHDREPVELVGCCLACTVRADLSSALDLVTTPHRWREIVVSLPSSVTPVPVAAALRAHSSARPDTVAVIVDAVLLSAQLSGGDLLADRGREAAPTDRRSTAELLVALIEDADVLVVGGLHRLQPDAGAHVQALLAHLGPLAVQVPVGPDGSGATAAVSTGRSTDPVGGDERERLAGLAAALCPPHCGVTTTVWSAERALHPGRLRDALEDLVRAVVRSRGYISLAGRPGQRVRWESAGEGLSFSHPVTAEGPPSCELLLTGTDLDVVALRALLDSCLADARDPAQDMRAEDPFTDALGPSGAFES